MYVFFEVGVMDRLDGKGFESLEWTGGTASKTRWDRWEAVSMEIYKKQLLNIWKKNVKQACYVGQRSNVSLCENTCYMMQPGCFFSFFLNFQYLSSD